jgi:hypothetical protein
MLKSTGFYSKQVQEGEIADLGKAEGFKEEIGMMQVVTRRLLKMARGCRDMGELINELGACGLDSTRQAGFIFH